MLSIVKQPRPPHHDGPAPPNTLTWDSRSARPPGCTHPNMLCRRHRACNWCSPLRKGGRSRSPPQRACRRCRRTLHTPASRPCSETGGRVWCASRWQSPVESRASSSAGHGLVPLTQVAVEYGEGSAPHARLQSEQALSAQRVHVTRSPSILGPYQKAQTVHVSASLRGMAGREQGCGLS